MTTHEARGQELARVLTLEANKKTVLDFYEKAVNQRDPEAAARHIGPRYVQHNPAIEDGVDGFLRFARELNQRFPRARGDIKRVFADRDFVILHVHARRESGEAGMAIVDIFRLEAGKIVEHWDVRQLVPEISVNSNGMF